MAKGANAQLQDADVSQSAFSVGSETIPRALKIFIAGVLGLGIPAYAFCAIIFSLNPLFFLPFIPYSALFGGATGPLAVFSISLLTASIAAGLTVMFSTWLIGKLKMRDPQFAKNKSKGQDLLEDYQLRKEQLKQSPEERAQHSEDHSLQALQLSTYDQIYHQLHRGTYFDGKLLKFAEGDAARVNINKELNPKYFSLALAEGRRSAAQLGMTFNLINPVLRAVVYSSYARYIALNPGAAAGRPDSIHFSARDASDIAENEAARQILATDEGNVTRLGQYFAREIGIGNMGESRDDIMVLKTSAETTPMPNFNDLLAEASNLMQDNPKKFVYEPLWKCALAAAHYLDPQFRPINAAARKRVMKVYCQMAELYANPSNIGHGQQFSASAMLRTYLGVRGKPVYDQKLGSAWNHAARDLEGYDTERKRRLRSNETVSHSALFSRVDAEHYEHPRPAQAPGVQGLLPAHQVDYGMMVEEESGDEQGYGDSPRGSEEYNQSFDAADVVLGNGDGVPLVRWSRRGSYVPSDEDANSMAPPQHGRPGRNGYQRLEDEEQDVSSGASHSTSTDTSSSPRSSHSSSSRSSRRSTTGSPGGG